MSSPPVHLGKFINILEVRGCKELLVILLQLRKKRRKELSKVLLLLRWGAIRALTGPPLVKIQKEDMRALISPSLLRVEGYDNSHWSSSK